MWEAALAERASAPGMQGLPPREGAPAPCPADRLFVETADLALAAVTVTPSPLPAQHGVCVSLHHQPPATAPPLQAGLWLLWPDLSPLSTGYLTDQKMQTHL